MNNVTKVHLSYGSLHRELLVIDNEKKGITSFGDLCSDFGANVKFLNWTKNKNIKKSILEI